MSLKTLIQFLLGNSEAIKTIAHHPQSLWVGLIFVLSAGIAREYDQEDLLHAPWYVLIPLAASLTASFLLYVVVRFMYWLPKPEIRNSQLSYRTFLGLFWMTAPLAWIYAIPVERLMASGPAVQMNLLFLGVVSLWRVLLISKVIALLWGASPINTFFVVMLFSEAMVFVAFNLTPFPVINLMGGIHLTDAERHITSATILVTLFSIISFPAWLAFSVEAAYCFQRKRREGLIKPLKRSEYSLMSRSVWGIGALSLIFWLPVLPFTQPEQQNQRQVDELMRAGEVKQAIHQMSKLQRDDFPPHWEPPPHFGYGESSPRLDIILDNILTTDSSTWVLEMHLEKIKRYAGKRTSWFRPVFEFYTMEEQQLERFVVFLESDPKRGRSLAILLEDELEYSREDIKKSQRWHEVTDFRNELIQRIHNLIPERDPTQDNRSQ